MTVQHEEQNEQFQEALTALAASLGWSVRSFRRDEERVGLAALEQDPAFEQVLWIYDPRSDSLRCLVVVRAPIPPHREREIVELCARINDGLIFGCAEYGFAEQVVVFRDSVPVGAPWPQLLQDLTGRLLRLAAHYWPAVAETIAGAEASQAMARVQEQMEVP